MKMNDNLDADQERKCVCCKRSGTIRLIVGFFLTVIIPASPIMLSAIANAGSSGQQPYGGIPWTVPGILEAEDYDTGGEGVAYHDRSVGNKGGKYRTEDIDIRYSKSEGYYTFSNARGEWLEYTVDVAATDEYRLDFRVATPKDGRLLRVDLDGVDVSGLIHVPNTGGWQAWQTFSAAANLSAGQHVLRVTFVVGGLNFSRIDASAADGLDISDNFNDGNANGWTPVNDSGYSPKWRVVKGQYRQRNFTGYLGTALEEGYHLGTYAYLSAWGGASNYRFSVKATPLAQSGLEIGVMFHYQNSDNYYRVSFSYADGTSRLESKVKGLFTTLAQNARGYPIGTPLNIVCEVNDGLIQVFVNGEKLFSAYDTSLSSGTVALYCRDVCAFDDVTIVPARSEASISIASPTDYSVFPTSTFDVSAVVSNKPADGTVLFELDGNSNACTAATEVWPGLFEAQCTDSSVGFHALIAELNIPGRTIDSDVHNFIATGGNYIISIGDSVSWGMKDFYDGDGTTQDGSVIMLQGFQSNLVDALNESPFAPETNIVFKEAVPGDNSALVLNKRLATILERHPNANLAILFVGINDAGGTTPTASGEGRDCSGSTCTSTFKGYIKATIDSLHSAGITPIVVPVPPRFGDNAVSAPYPDPLAEPVNDETIPAYNRIIKGQDANPLTGYILGPDTFDYFLGGGKNRYTLFYDNLHPGALGHEVLAALIRNRMTGETDLPLVLDDICVNDASGGTCTVPTLYKQDLIASGDAIYIDALGYKLAGVVPAALRGGRWIRTANADRYQSNSDYLSFAISQGARVYVAYDAGATILPAWLQPAGGFVDTGMQIQTTNATAPVYKLYRQNFPAGNVTLGGADATDTGAAVNYVVIVN